MSEGGKSDILYLLGQLDGKMDSIIKAWDSVHERFSRITVDFAEVDKRHNELTDRVTIIETRTKTALAIGGFLVTLIFGTGVWYHFFH